MRTPNRTDPRPFLYLALGLAAWWLLPGTFRLFVRDGFSAFRAPADSVASHLRDLRVYWEKRAGMSRPELIKANVDATRATAALETRVNELLALAAENRRLAQMLELQPRDDYRAIVARVVRRDITTWWRRLVLRRGSADGVRVRSPVVVGGGYAVGVVIAVSTHSCEVRLVSDPGFRVSANVEGANESAAVFQGIETRPFAPPTGEITYLAVPERPPGNTTLRDAYIWRAEGDTTPSLALAAAGGGDPRYLPVFTDDGAARPRPALEIYTSGSGGIFPPGLKLGVVEDGFTKTPDGLFFQGGVRLHPQLNSLEEVAILIPTTPLPLDAFDAPAGNAGAGGGRTAP